VAQCRVGHGRVQRQVPKRSHETRVKVGSNRDSLKVAKCLVISLASRGDGLTTFPSSVTTYLLTWTMTWTRTSTSGACLARFRVRPGRRRHRKGHCFRCCSAEFCRVNLSTLASDGVVPSPASEGAVPCSAWLCYLCLPIVQCRGTIFF
jgi:hypothetical protein